MTLAEFELPLTSGVSGAPASRPWHYRDFRILWISNLLSGVGYTAETVVLGWLLLERTDSAFYVSLGIAVRALPNLLLGIPGGALVDRFDRRLVIQVVGLGSGFCAAALGSSALAGTLTTGLVLAVTFLSGAMRSLALTARRTYAFDIVGGSQAMGGLASLSLGARGGGIIGGVGAGFLLALAGAGEAYLVVAGWYGLSGVILLLARTRGQAAPESRPPVWQGIKEFVVEVRDNSALRLLVVLTAAVEVLGFSYQAVLPSLARDLLEVGAEGLGLLTTFTAVGGALVLLVVTVRGGPQRQGQSFLAVIVIFGVSLLVLAGSSSFLVGLFAILSVSSMAAMSDLLSQSLIQSAVANDLRGRAMGSWIVAIGLGPLGHLQIGALAGLLGVTTALLINGALLIALAAAAILIGRQVKQL